MSRRAIVVGYGPVGETVTELLLDNHIEPTVIELNLERLGATGEQIDRERHRVEAVFRKG